MSPQWEEPLAPGHVEEPKKRNLLLGSQSPPCAEPGTMQPLIPAHTVGPQPLFGVDSPS